MFIRSVNGIYIYDNNNNKYIDTRFGAGTFILGHIKHFNKEINNQIQRGTLFGYASENETILKNNLKKQLNWFDDFIFCNSGSESIMRVFRIARSYTKKKKIAIFSSFWHGGYDGTQIKNDNDNKIVSSSGIINSQIDDLILLPNNNIEKAIEILDLYKNKIAMVFFEPVQQIVPHINKKLLIKIRKYTEYNNILLGFDEMITGFRLSIGGAQEYFNIYADIACYGKIIGGGFPIGVVGFNKKIKEHIKIVEPPIRFGGTFSGNPLSMFSGNLILNYLVNNKNKIYKTINNLTKKMCDSVNNYCIKNKYPIHLYYVGSFYRIIFTDKEVVSMKERKKFEISIKNQKFFFDILKKNGLLVASNPLAFISYAHNIENINLIINIYKKSISEYLINY